MSKIIKSFPVAGGPHEIDVNGNQFLSISLSDPDAGTTQLTGTLTFEGRVPGAVDYEALSPNSIDIAAPVTLTVQNQILDSIRVTIAGFTGTATNLNIALNDWGVVRS